MSRVCIVKKDCFQYPQVPPFRPAIKYPECPFHEFSTENEVYDQVRECLKMMELDIENFGSVEWNPLGDIINPGDNVLIKPNMVMDRNAIAQNGTDCLFTHPSVVMAVVDYVCIALKGKGKIVIGDAPMQECAFDRLLENSGYTYAVSWYRNQGVDISIKDFRELTSEIKGGLREQTLREGARGTVVDLGGDSEHAGTDNCEDYRITNYDPNELKKHHTTWKHEYYINKDVLQADVIINMPKPKSHRKAGMTAAMKNFVGINVRKEYLPHHTFASKEEGGDEYLKKDFFHFVASRIDDKRNVAVGNHRMILAQSCRLMSKLIKTIHPFEDYSEGSWYGNHTISKTICDLNKIIMYADKHGVMQDSKQRKIIHIADMIVSGEKEGPISPTPKNVGIIAIGENQVLLDEIIAELMGFDKKKLPFLVNARNTKGRFSLCDDEVELITNYGEIHSMCFEPTAGWRGHIEKANSQ